MEEIGFALLQLDSVNNRITMRCKVLIVSFIWNDISDASTGVRNIILAAWNEVDVTMKNDLSCINSLVDTHIETLDT